MFNRFVELGFEGSYLGLPTSREVSVAGGTYQDFQGGRLYWRPGLSSAIDMSTTFINFYTNVGAEKSYLGLPSQKMTCGIKDNGCWMMFDKGKVYYSPITGIYDIFRGAIDNKHAELGWENGKLGYPISREIQTGSTCNNHKDVKQEFQGGTVFWSACATPTVKVEFK